MYPNDKIKLLQNYIADVHVHYDARPEYALSRLRRIRNLAVDMINAIETSNLSDQDNQRAE